MAKLSARGRTELARFEYASKRIARMSDGNILVSYGRGWSQYGKLKPGIDPATSAREAQAKYDARPVEFHLYIKALMNACAAITLMPEDADGVWSTLDDRHFGSGPDLEDCVRACRAYQSLMRMAEVTV
jgi:hypothetical protein